MAEAEIIKTEKTCPFSILFAYLCSMKLLIIDDNVAVLRSLKLVLNGVFDQVVTMSNPQLLPALLSNNDVDAVLLDMNFNAQKLDGSEGLLWLELIKKRDNPPAVVMITAFGDVPLAVEAMKRGAEDFITKPWDNDELIEKLHKAIAKRDRNMEEQRLMAEAHIIKEREKDQESMTLEELKAQHIKRIIKEANGNLTLAAERLGINRQTLYNQMKKF
ncbi:MAG: response regulator [Prevotella sp.]|nr:response regulator [Prevotella sp.]